jgi:Fe2+ transport system protein FeoA
MLSGTGNIKLLENKMDAMSKMISYPLLLAGQNETLYITEIKGGRHFKEKCIDRGIIPGQKIKILNKQGSGPCLVLVMNSRIMIGHGMLSRIYVRPE